MLVEKKYVEKTEPNSTIAVTPTARLRFLKMESGTIGYSVRDSHQTNVTSRTTAKPRRSSNVESVHGCSPLSSSANTAVPMPTVTSTEPTTSSREPLGARLSGTKRGASTS